MTKNFRTFETEVGGRKVVVEVGKYCEQAGGSCVVRCGDTVVLVNATMSAKPRDGMDFFPLSVDFEEKMYSVGKIPGSFKRREARPSDKAILTSRLIDRPIRPLFPKGLFNDVTVIATCLSVDPNIPPEVYAMIGSSVALSISDIPWAARPARSSSAMWTANISSIRTASSAPEACCTCRSRALRTPS